MSTSVELFIHELGINTRNAEKTANSFPTDIQAGAPAPILVYKGDSTGSYGILSETIGIPIGSGNFLSDLNQTGGGVTFAIKDSSGSVADAFMTNAKISVAADSTYLDFDSTSNLGLTARLTQTDNIVVSQDLGADPGVNLLDSITLNNEMLKVNNITGQPYPPHYHQNLNSLQSAIIAQHPTTSGTNVQDSSGGQWSYSNIVRATKDGLEALDMTSRSYGLGTWNQSVTYPEEYTMYLLCHMNNNTSAWKSYYSWNNSSSLLLWIDPSGNIGTYTGTLFNQYIDQNSWQRIVLQGKRNGTSGSSTNFKLWINGNGPYTKQTYGPSATDKINYYYSYSSYYPQYVAMTGIVEGSSDEIAFHLNQQMAHYMDNSNPTGVAFTKNISTFTGTSSLASPPHAKFDVNAHGRTGDSAMSSGLSFTTSNNDSINHLDLNTSIKLAETGKVFCDKDTLYFGHKLYGSSVSSVEFFSDPIGVDLRQSDIKILHPRDVSAYSPLSSLAQSITMIIKEEAPIAFFKDSVGLGTGNRFELLDKFNDPRLAVEPVQQNQTSGPVQIWF